MQIGAGAEGTTLRSLNRTVMLHMEEIRCSALNLQYAYKLFTITGFKHCDAEEYETEDLPAIQHGWYFAPVSNRAGASEEKT